MKDKTSILYKTDGTQEDVLPANSKWFTLEELQGFVKGYIELVYLHDNLIIVCNEEAKLHDLKMNPGMTEIYIKTFGPIDVILGNALLIHKSLMH